MNEAEGIELGVAETVGRAIELCRELGAEVGECELPRSVEYGLPCYYLIAPSEASSNLARYDGVRYGPRSPDGDFRSMVKKTRDEGFGDEPKRRIMLGTYALSSGYYEAYYGKAQAVRTLICQDFTEAFKEVDLIVTPVTPTPAFRLGEKSEDPLQMYLSDIFTISVNLAGLPAIALPCGLSKAGLPIGLQIIGQAFKEDTMLRAAHAYEQSTQWHLKRPTVR
jgi:aspartyl-tRNA(Asn)/glutamyl-tRNA(Gln) amidotransferase subunit A